jgi:ATP phosphoribosyltransferase
MLRIALPNKGRLSDDTRDLFNQAGLEVRVRGDRALTASLGGEFEAIFVRAQDVPEFVADGAADAGITGFDIVSESERELDCLLDLEFGQCRLVIACRDESPMMSVNDIEDRCRIATAFPSIARNYFATLRRDVQVVPISGAAEIAPHLGIADVILDVTSTGSTLRVNGLREIGAVMKSSARMYAAPSRISEWAERKLVALDQLSVALESVVRARGKRYLMANVPKSKLDDVRRLLPGISGPTIIDILSHPELVAAHAVVDESAMLAVVNGLKALGATGILVLPIERLVP